MRDADRRRLIQLAAAGATALWLPRGALAQPRPFERDPFPLGVASGSPRADSVVLWTRLMGLAPGTGAVPVRWEVADDEGFRRIVQQGTAQAAAELAHSVHAEVPGLAPDRWYFYRFMAGDAVSPTGRTRTFPAPDAQPARVRLAYASCQRWEHGHYAAYRHMRADQPDAVLFLGDYIYEYNARQNAVRTTGAGPLLTLSDYRARHALHKGDADLQAMHAACPWLVTWDDHEVQNDYAGLHGGDGLPDFAARRRAAYQAFYEHMPLRSGVLTRALAGLREGAQMRIHSQVRFGRLANVLLLDTRQYKDPQLCTPPGRTGSGMADPALCGGWNDARRSMLGAAQEQWLDGALAASGEGWSVIGQSTLFGRRDTRPGPEEFLWNDGWDGYGPARQRLTDALQKHRAANPVLLGGDVHEHWVGQVKADYRDPRSGDVGVEFCGTSITSRTTADRAYDRLLAENPHFIYGDGSRRGYGLAEFTRERLEVRLRGLHDAARADSGIEDQARFEVPAGRPRVERTA